MEKVKRFFRDISISGENLRYFVNRSKDISTFEAYVSIGLLRLFGGVFLAISLMVDSVLAKRYAITLFTGAASVIIPYIGLPQTYIYRLCLEQAFLQETLFQEMPY